MIPYGRSLYRVLVIVEANLLAESEDNIRSSIRTALEGFYNDLSEVRDPIESVIYYKVHSCNSAIARAWVILISEYYREDYDGQYNVERTNFPTEEICSNESLLNSYINERINPSDPKSPYNVNYNYIFKFFYNLLPLDDSDTPDLEYLNRYSEIQPDKQVVINQNLLQNEVEKLSYWKGTNSDKSSYSYRYPEYLPYPDVNENLSLVDEESSSYYDKPEIDQYSINSEEYEKSHFILSHLFDTIIWVYST